MSPVEDTQIVSISYTDKDPAIAQMITNAVVKGYMAEMLEIKLASTSYQLNWMTDKAEQEREKLERSERALQKYMRDNDLVTLEDRLTIYPQKLSEFSSQLSRGEARAQRTAVAAKPDRGDWGAISTGWRRFRSLPTVRSSQKCVRRSIGPTRRSRSFPRKYGPQTPGDDQGQR